MFHNTTLAAKQLSCANIVKIDFMKSIIKTSNKFVPKNYKFTIS